MEWVTKQGVRFTKLLQTSTKLDAEFGAINFMARTNSV